MGGVMSPVIVPRTRWTQATTDGGAEVVYLLHIEKAIAGHAGHYCGSTEDLVARLTAHANGTSGARLMEVVHERRAGFHLVRTWYGGRDLERQFKDAQHLSRWCPDCAPCPRISLPNVTPRRVRRARHVETPAGMLVPRPRPVLATQAARGRRFARQFLAERQAWTADEIEQAAAAFQEPYYSSPRTPGGDALNAAFGRVIEAALAALRAPMAVAS
jgi:hypothetical protein